jgi:pilus assembly protein CpaF
MAIDQRVVRRLREEVADLLSRQRREDAVTGVPAMTSEDERQYARAVIGRVLDLHARSELSLGNTPPTTEEETELAEGIHAALFGVGRLQPLLDDPMVENIDINGCDQVFVSYSDGREQVMPAVAESDEELIELIQLLGAYSGLSSRSFDAANPQLDLRLPDGSRLSAVMGVCPRPAVSIRRSRLSRVTLDDLVRNGSVTEELAAFLASAVTARKNIMIAGATNAGKTTMLRALAHEISPQERLITVERALELGLGEFADLHPNVVALEERLPNSEGQGSIGMGDLVRRSLRMNPSRVIVGEVLGDEIVTMLNAMSQGNDGSLSTIHANSSLEVFNRICTYAIQSAERLPTEATMMLIAGAIDFVIFVERRNEYADGGQLRRIVTSVREVNGVDGRVLSSEVFSPGADGRAVPAAPISCIDELVEAGYHPAMSAGWV